MTIAIFLVPLCVSLAVGVPIAFSLIVSAIALMVSIGMFSPLIISQNLVSGADNYQLMAVPFFLLAGELMNRGGLSRRIVDFAMSFVGHWRGGLGYVAIFAALILAAISGSAAADAAAVGAFLIPMMRTAGYNVIRASGLVATAGIVAPVIPPSVGFIMFGVAANVSISQLFLAGILPGLLMAGSLLAVWIYFARVETEVKPLPRATWRQRGRALIDGGLALVMPVIILGGIRFGIVTPTEAGVVAAVYALLVSFFVYRQIKIRDLFGILRSAAYSTASIMFLIAAAMIPTWLIAQSDVPGQLAGIIEPFRDNHMLFLFATMLLVFLVGTALDFGPTILILTPILMPLVKEIGINQVYFGVLFIIVNAIGLITPPVGIVLNVVGSISGLSMDKVTKGVAPFLLANLAVVALLIVFPDLVMAPLRWMTK